MKILLIGNSAPSHLGGAYYRALLSLGFDVCFVDELAAFGWWDRQAFSSFVQRIRGHLPTRVTAFNQIVLDAARRYSPDLILSVKGSYLKPETIGELKQTSRALLVNYSTDNPFNPAASTRYVRNSLPLWDIYVTPRAHTIHELEQHCKGAILYLPFGYDPEFHFPEQQISTEEARRFTSELTFIGTCDQDRVEILRFLASQDVSVRLFGGGRRYRLIKALRRRHSGPVTGREYRLAMNCSKIVLSLNRKANRDTHVMRTFEVPACGSFMLAERSEEQLAMFVEDQEAVFFSGAEELWEKARYYLAHDDLRRRIAHAGFHRVTTGRNTYRDRLSVLMEQLAGRRRSPAGRYP